MNNFFSRALSYILPASQDSTSLDNSNDVVSEAIRKDKKYSADIPREKSGNDESNPKHDHTQENTHKGDPNVELIPISRIDQFIHYTPRPDKDGLILIYVDYDGVGRTYIGSRIETQSRIRRITVEEFEYYRNISLYDEPVSSPVHFEHKEEVGSISINNNREQDGYRHRANTSEQDNHVEHNKHLDRSFLEYDDDGSLEQQEEQVIDDNSKQEDSHSSHEVDYIDTSTGIANSRHYVNTDDSEQESVGEIEEENMQKGDFVNSSEFDEVESNPGHSGLYLGGNNQENVNDTDGEDNVPNNYNNNNYISEDEVSGVQARLQLDNQEQEYVSKFKVEDTSTLNYHIDPSSNVDTSKIQFNQTRESNEHDFICESEVEDTNTPNDQEITAPEDEASEIYSNYDIENREGTTTTG